MKQVIWLPDNEPRCVPTACTKGKPCARQALPQALGRPQSDFSVPGGTWVAECCDRTAWARFVPLGAAVKPVEPKKAKEWIGAQ